MGRCPPAPTGPRVASPAALVRFGWVAPPPRGERGLLHRKQSRRLAKLGENWHSGQVQSPGCAERPPPVLSPWPRGRMPRLALRPRTGWSRPCEPGLVPLRLPPSYLPEPLECRSTLSSNSRNPWWRIESTLLVFAPPPSPRRCGMRAAARSPPPPPPWCAARRCLAAPRAMRARAVCRWRRCLRCHACSPRAVAWRRRPDGRAAGRRHRARRNEGAARGREAAAPQRTTPSRRPSCTQAARNAPSRERGGSAKARPSEARMAATAARQRRAGGQDGGRVRRLRRGAPSARSARHAWP